MHDKGSVTAVLIDVQIDPPLGDPKDMASSTQLMQQDAAVGPSKQANAWLPAEPHTLPREEPLLVNHLKGAICAAPVSQADIIEIIFPSVSFLNVAYLDAAVCECAGVFWSSERVRPQQEADPGRSPEMFMTTRLKRTPFVKGPQATVHRPSRTLVRCNLMSHLNG
ncbi:unnamed protein product [Leuciscus chuanchicus]